VQSRTRLAAAWAIISCETNTAKAKMDILESLELYVSRKPTRIGQTILQAMMEKDLKV
jgi:succinyl-CoA synthetase alpha subunit